MKRKLLLFLVGLGMVGFVPIANAAVILNLGGCDYTADQGGSGACGGSGADIAYNSMIMTFVNNGNDTVRMTLDTTNMSEGLGKISDVWFNADGFDINDLTFNHVSGVEAQDITTAGNVGNMGIFDFDTEFSTSGSLGSFHYGMTSIYDITGNNLTEDAFESLSTKNFAAAFHLNITGNGESGHYTTATAPVPEPTTLFLFGVGLAGLVGVARKKRM